MSIQRLINQCSLFTLIESSIIYKLIIFIHQTFNFEAHVNTCTWYILLRLQTFIGVEYTCYVNKITWTSFPGFLVRNYLTCILILAFPAMWNRLISLLISSMMLIVIVENSLQGNQIVNCASCFSQKWEWSSWQCDVHCNVEKSPYGR